MVMVVVMMMVVVILVGGMNIHVIFVVVPERYRLR